MIVLAAALTFCQWFQTSGLPAPTNLEQRVECRARYCEYRGWTNKAGVVRSTKCTRLSQLPMKMRLTSSVVSEPLDPVDSFHEFVRGRKVDIPKDNRPKDYSKEVPEVRPPRRKR